MKPSHNYLIIGLLILLAQNFAIAALNDTGITTCSNATQNGLPCPVSAPPSKEKAASALANIAMPFEENRGQTDAKVAFQARTLGWRNQNW